MWTLTSLLTTASPFVVAVLEIVPSLTALLWATATFTKSQPTGRELFGTHISPMFLSMNLWPRYSTVRWPPIKSYAPTTRLGCMPGDYLLTHLPTISTHTSSPCTLLILYSLKALAPGPTALLLQPGWLTDLLQELSIVNSTASSHVWGALPCRQTFFKNSWTSITQPTLCNLSSPMLRLQKDMSMTSPLHSLPPHRSACPRSYFSLES